MNLWPQWWIIFLGILDGAKTSFDIAELDHASKEDYVAFPKYTAVVGEEIHLPCNITFPSQDDAVSLVLWYKLDTKMPVYSVDARNSPMDKAKHFPSESFVSRTHFDMFVRPAVLHIKEVKEDDAGEYRCRVDYRWARTQNTIVRFDVIVLPQAITIKDGNGEVLQNVTPSYNEGAEVQFTCESYGGKPLPSVIWWRNSVIIDETYVQVDNTTVRNDYIIPELRRQDLKVVLTCEASNTNLSAPVKQSVVLDINLKPIDVQIITIRRPLTIGKPLDVVCQTCGSRPAANISWWLNDEELNATRQDISHGGNVTTGTLTLWPTSNDDGASLRCLSENPLIPNSGIEDEWVLNVYFPPLIELSIANGVHHDIIEEGDTLRLLCNVRANPRIVALVWYFDDHPMITNISLGIFIDNDTLILKNARKTHTGRYKCDASNVEGRGESNELYIKVQYSPVCKEGQKENYRVLVGEPARVSCEVDADPAEVNFTWTFNNSRENRKLLKFVTEGLCSTVTYTPLTKHDYGTITCHTSNKVGKQKQPCVFSLYPAGPPDALTNCTISNYSYSALHVECVPGHDGGFEQTFHLEVHNSSRQKLLYNMSSSDYPSFHVTNLTSASTFLLILYSANAQGRSSAVILTALTLALPETKGNKEAGFIESVQINPLVGVLIGIIVTLLLIVVFILGVIRFRKEDDSDQGEVRERLSKQPSPLPCVSQERGGFDTKSPDIIPPITDIFDYSKPMRGSSDEDCDSSIEEKYRFPMRYQNQYDVSHSSRSPRTVYKSRRGNIITTECEIHGRKYIQLSTIPECVESFLIEFLSRGQKSPGNK